MSYSDIVAVLMIGDSDLAELAQEWLDAMPSVPVSYLVFTSVVSR